jgi:prepilin-type processing-associated H-X9-DG protein
VLIAILIPVLLPKSSQDREKANLARCKENLRVIGAGMLLYAQSNNGALPVGATVENPHPELTALVPKYVSEPKMFYCPSETQSNLLYSQQNFNAGSVGYFYYSAAQASSDDNLSQFLLSGIVWPRELHTGMDPKSWVMSDAWFSGVPTAHPGFRKGVNYLMLDGSVDFVSESPRQAFH